MKLTDEQLKKLLQEQAELEQRHLTKSDMEAYTLLFESLDREKAAADRSETPDITDDVMAKIVLLEDKEDRKKDVFNLTLGVSFGFLAIATVYFFVDFSLLETGFLWIKEHVSIIAFAVIAICLIQVADKKLVGRNSR